jgi:hypothetical protein
MKMSLKISFQRTSGTRSSLLEVINISVNMIHPLNFNVNAYCCFKYLDKHNGIKFRIILFFM